jgi:hypothetical protein
MSNQWREEQNRCLREIERLQAANRSYMDEGVQLLELARNAQRLFAKQEPCEKRRLLNFLLSNCTWQDGKVVATLRQPFDLLAETAVTAARAAEGETAKTAKIDIWLDQAVKQHSVGRECREASTPSYLGFQPLQKTLTVHVRAHNILLGERLHWQRS